MFSKHCELGLVIAIVSFCCGVIINRIAIATAMGATVVGADISRLVAEAVRTVALFRRYDWRAGDFG